MKWLDLLLAHGTIERTEDMRDFLMVIRRGRPPSEELVREMVERYEAIGGSPLLAHTRSQAEAVQTATGVPCRVAMRLWAPRVGDLATELEGVDGVVLIPLAPFSVGVYEQAARRELSSLGFSGEVRAVAPWGEAPELIEAYLKVLEGPLNECGVAGTRVILTAHSLPTRVVQAGDDYQARFSRTAQLVAESVTEGHPGLEVVTCYQSQGADGGDWLGPSLEESLDQAKNDGVARVVVHPIGFFAEHVETLYDLDIEAANRARALGLGFHRVPTLMTHPGLVRTLAAAAEQARR